MESTPQKLDYKLKPIEIFLRIRPKKEGGSSGEKSEKQIAGFEVYPPKILIDGIEGGRKTSTYDYAH